MRLPGRTGLRGRHPLLPLLLLAVTALAAAVVGVPSAGADYDPGGGASASPAPTLESYVPGDPRGTTCTNRMEVHVAGDASEVHAFYSRDCEDGQLHIWGQVRDTSCDQRGVKAVVNLFSTKAASESGNSENPGPGKVGSANAEAVEFHNDGQGCNTASGIDFSTRNAGKLRGDRSAGAQVCTIADNRVARAGRPNCSWLSTPVTWRAAPAAPWPSHHGTVIRCGAWTSFHVSVTGVELLGDYSRDCADGELHIFGSVRDSKCDAKQAKAYIITFSHKARSVPWWNWRDPPGAGNVGSAEAESDETAALGGCRAYRPFYVTTGGHGDARLADGGEAAAGLQVCAMESNKRQASGPICRWQP